MPAAPKIHKNLKNRRPVSNGRQSTVDKSECSKSTIILKPKEQHVQIPTFSPGRKSTQAPADYEEKAYGEERGPTEESFKKTTTMTIVGLCSFSAFIAILVCLIARHRWKQKAKQRRASIDARYGSTVIKRHLNAASSSIRSRQLAGQPDFI
uniref:Uncharacterized protein n=1 Tax=Romanomermis culicivorax TaxID=13658 RepID=A0A915KEH6_ROMCU